MWFAFDCRVEICYLICLPSLAEASAHESEKMSIAKPGICSMGLQIHSSHAVLLIMNG